MQENNNWLEFYQPPQADLWLGRSDSDIPECFHQIIELIDLTTNNIPDNDNYTFVFIGFASDEGVKREQGRTGAIEGATALRKALVNLPFNYYNHINVYDVGDIYCKGYNLEQAQEALGAVIEKILLAGCHPIVLGGGRETAWGHYQGIAQTSYSNNLGVINLGAHFGLKPKLNGDMGTSGSVFSQIAEDREFEELDFNYFCIGIQPMANTLSLYEEAEILGVDYIEASELASTNNVGRLENFAAFIKNHDHLYLSISLDIFSSAIASGVSAPQPLGLIPQNVLPYLRLLAASDKVISLDMVELAPKYDQNNNTANLGAQLIADYINIACLEDE
jgi:formiminoglutamase